VRLLYKETKTVLQTEVEQFALQGASLCNANVTSATAELASRPDRGAGRRHKPAADEGTHDGLCSTVGRGVTREIPDHSGPHGGSQQCTIVRTALASFDM
jgi:hypothetical protein